MKKAAKKKATKKVAKKKPSGAAKKAKPAKFDFAKLLEHNINGKGKIYVKITGPETWEPGSSIKKTEYAEIDYAQFTKPTTGDKAEMFPGSCWAEYTLTKIHCTAEPDAPYMELDYDSAIYDGGN